MKNIRKYGSFVAIILFLGVIAFFVFNQNVFLQKATGENIKYIKIAGQMLKIELAMTQSEQEQGLSDRENLKNNEGMLFIFKKPSKNYFWMKDMNFPIDIVWINNNLEIVYIKENALPSSYPEIFCPDIDSKYVLEVNSGFSKNNNLKVGEIVKFLP